MFFPKCYKKSIYKLPKNIKKLLFLNDLQNIIFTNFTNLQELDNNIKNTFI